MAPTLLTGVLLAVTPAHVTGLHTGDIRTCNGLQQSPRPATPHLGQRLGVRSSSTRIGITMAAGCLNTKVSHIRGE
jgi:hypothetical protein